MRGDVLSESFGWEGVKEMQVMMCWGGVVGVVGGGGGVVSDA